MTITRPILIKHYIRNCSVSLLSFLGDVLLSINGQDLTYLSHSEAVGTLKASAASPSVQLRVLEVSMVEEPDHDELLPHTHDSDFDANWSPSWVMWLGLPR